MSRVWVKLDATYPEDERIMAAGSMAELLFIRSICYCRRRVTDGHIPTSALRLLAFGIDSDAQALADTLVANELWIEIEDGWLLRSYEAWQQTKAGLAADAERKRSVRAERQREKKERDITRTSAVCPQDAARTSGDYTEPADVTDLETARERFAELRTVLA